MRIGVNALFLIPGGVGGTEIYLRRLLEAMETLETGHEIIVFTNRETGPLGRHPIVLPVRAAFRPGRILYEQFALPAVLRRERIGVLFNAGFTAPLLTSIPQVTIFQDLQHKRHPEFFRWFDLPFWQFLLWAAARRSRRLIAASQATRDDLRRFYGAESVVIHHGVEQAFFDLAARREDSGYLLCASTTHPHKNHERLLRVFSLLLRERPESRLVLTGVRGFVAGRVESLVQELQLQHAVELKGWVPREELHELFRRARGFVYPTRFEGFGLPVLEAMAAGLPLACSRIEPLQTIAAGAAWLFDPDSDAEMLAALRRIADGDAAPGGRERAAAFSWASAAAATLRVLLEASQTGRANPA